VILKKESLLIHIISSGSQQRVICSGSETASNDVVLNSESSAVVQKPHLMTA
jgi:hypothetical protein